MVRGTESVTTDEACEIITALMRANQAHQLWLQGRISGEARSFHLNQLHDLVIAHRTSSNLVPALREFELQDHHFVAFNTIEGYFKPEQKKDLKFFSDILKRNINSQHSNLYPSKNLANLWLVFRILLLLTIIFSVLALSSLALGITLSQLSIISSATQLVLMACCVGSCSLFGLGTAFTLLTNAILNLKPQTISVDPELPGASPPRQECQMLPPRKLIGEMPSSQVPGITRPTPGVSTPMRDFLPTPPPNVVSRAIVRSSSLWQRPTAERSGTPGGTVSPSKPPPIMRLRAGL